jgi:hypothetical protein
LRRPKARPIKGKKSLINIRIWRINEGLPLVDGEIHYALHQKDESANHGPSVPRRLKRSTMTIVATAKPAPYVDPSALTKLYIREPESAAMNAWRRRHPLVLTVTHHGRAEITNAIGLAVFRQQITFESSIQIFLVVHTGRWDALHRGTALP